MKRKIPLLQRHTSLKKYVFFISLLFVSFKSFGQAPVIRSLTPNSGLAGTTVVIQGNNFNTTAANNVVYFGKVKAMVSSASSTSITLKVPKGAGARRVTVTNLDNGLTAYSPKPFVVKFEGGDAFFNSSSFAGAVSFPAGGAPVNTVSGDLDDDGKADVVCTLSSLGGSRSSLSVLKNTSTYSKISFAPSMEIPNFLSSGAESAQLADVDGDGRLDIAVASFGQLTIFRNLSTLDNIHFSEGQIFTVNSSSQSAFSLETDDLDNDGKPDFALNNNGTVLVFRNTSTIGNIALSSPATFIANGSTDSQELKIGDIDEDGKADICVVNSLSHTLCVLRNVSGAGTISFDNALSVSTGNDSYPRGLAISDIDGDGKPDVSIADYYLDRLIFYKNKSTRGECRFGLLRYYSDQYQTSIIRTADLNGDGKVDVLNNNPTFGAISIIRNNSNPCSPMMDAQVRISGYAYSFFDIHDLNGDGKPEIIVPFLTANTVVVFENRISQTIPGCSGGTTVFSSSVTGTAYQWQQNSGTGFLNINDNTNFSGSNTATLQVTNPSLLWNGFKYRCLVNGDTSNILIHAVSDNFVPYISISNCPSDVCAGDTTLYTATITNGGSNPTLQWQDSSDLSGWHDISSSTTASLQYATNVAGTRVRCKMTSSYPCAVPATVTSNTSTINFICNTDINVCAGAATQLTSNISGSFYQWQVDMGGGYVSLSNDSIYSGVNTVTLIINNVSPAAYGYKYRCFTDGGNSNSFTIRFSNTWVGSVSSAWENPLNWSCLAVPGSNTDVKINSGQVLLNSNAVIRTLSILPSAIFSINPGFSLVIRH